MSKEFLSPATLPPPVGYSHIAKVNKGTMIYLAGQVSSDASGALVGEGNFEAQAERVFANVRIAVEVLRMIRYSMPSRYGRSGFQ